MRQILAITRKELESYFGSPLALIFLGVFLAAVLFIFFTIDTFFARGIADVRPVFQWMPVLLIFLLAALTMRQWSEEQRAGTQEILLTLPVKPIQLVLGKFLAVLALIALALLLTIPLPVTVSIIGRLDWGPVIGGYLAALLMAAAYAAIGLFVSSRTDNQIVALIATVLLGGLFYILGTPSVTNFFGRTISSILWAVGTGSRFESIERGVIDLRDLVYYLSLTGIFLTLNTISLDSKRWSQSQTAYRRRVLVSGGLIVLNLALVNLWVYPLQGLRLDLTAQKEYTLSPVTKDLLQNLQEPLLIRAYISEKTHPLLAPLVPQINDMLREYQIASNGKVQAETLDPLQDPEIEAEANQTYGIQPTPFQVSGRYEASVINSYFDILIRYGDQSTVLSFQDLIEVTPTADGVDVHLRNLEYDLTSAIKKVVFGFQSVDSVLAALDKPVHLTLYVTPNTLPSYLTDTANTMASVAQQIADSSKGKLVFETVNPDDPNSQENRQTLVDQYGIQPIPAALFSSDTFYMHLVLENGDQNQVVYPTGEMTDAEVRSAIESALKRTSSGFLKVVGIWSPPETPTVDMFGQQQQPLSTYSLIRQQLSQNYTVQDVDLSTGVVPADIDTLVIVAPQQFGEREVFAVDQYLMRGGSVVLAVSNVKPNIDPFSGLLTLESVDTGLTDLLNNYGIQLQKGLVMDRQNEPFPVAVMRNVGGAQVQEIQAVNYPFFVEIQRNGMASQNPLVSNLSAVTLNWASPVETNSDQSQGNDVEVLLNSSSDSWIRTNLDIQPDLQNYPQMGFPVEGDTQSYPLAVALQGTFNSLFRGRQAPSSDTSTSNNTASGDTSGSASSAGELPVVEESPSTARLVVIGSAEFLDDFVLNLSSRLSQDRYLNNLLFLQNAVDWSVEDTDLLTIRARGNFTRVLDSLTERQQTTWEIANYAVAILLLLGVYGAWQIYKRNEKPLPLIPPDAQAPKSKPKRKAGPNRQKGGEI
jgi:ABC-2 type transport system permease protein